MNIEDLNLTIRSHNGLTAAGITTVEQLVGLDWEQLDGIKNVGEKSISEICWQCIRLLNGRMTEVRIEWEKRWPNGPRQEMREMREKARKYDEIAKIMAKGH